MRKCVQACVLVVLVYLIGPDEMCLLHPSLHRLCVNAMHTYHKILVSGKNTKKKTQLNLNTKPRQQKLKEFVQAQTDWPGTQIERFF